jgi:cytochrome P450
MADSVALPQLPFEQADILLPPPKLRELQATCPIARVRTPTGDEAWHVVRFGELKQLLTDRCLGRSHSDPEHAPRISDSILFGGPAENFQTELSDHEQMRSLLTPFFSARRMDALRPAVDARLNELLDALLALTPPVDLHKALSFPLPVLVICDLLGVPYEDRHEFRAWTRDMADIHHPRRASLGWKNLIGYMRELVRRKRREPADDVISGLCQAYGGALSDEHVASLAAVLLFAGHETTVVRIDLGTLLLLEHPEQREILLQSPDLVDNAVEEILRASFAGGGGLPRYPREDVAIGNVVLRAGDAVMLDIGAANHDPAVFEHPDRFDVRRKPNPHLAFGYGPRYCIGAPLARIELQAVFARLFARFPRLRLAVPREQLVARDDVLTGGLATLPVTW